MIDSLFIPVMVMLIIIAVLVGLFVTNQILSALPIDEATKTSAVENLSTAVRIFIYVIYFGLPVGAIVLSLISGGNPILLVFSFILLILNVFISSLMKETFINFFSNFPEIQNFVSSDVLLTKLIEFYPLIMFIFGCLTIFAQFFA